QFLTAKESSKMPTTKKKPAATKTPARKPATRAATAKRATGRKTQSASKKGKKASTGLATRAQKLVPQELKKTAMKALAGAAAGAVRAIIPPLQQAVDSNQAAADSSKGRGG